MVGVVAVAWAACTVAAAELRSRNVFLLTTDGLRPEEVFRGADPELIHPTYGGVTKTNELRAAYLRATPEESRAALLPFLWGRIARQGQLWGNAEKGSVVRVTNGHNFSYPGYSEFLTGQPDARIDSNDARPNPNENVFQWLHAQRGFQGRVGAAVSWGVIPWILNADQAGFPVFSAFEVPPGTRRFPLSPVAADLLRNATPLWADVSLDTFTGAAAKEMVRALKPRAMYVAFGETDDWAHEGRYDRMLHAAHAFDRFVGELWDLVQSLPQYRDRTTFILATDHGRGPAPVAWKNHGKAIAASSRIWIGLLGPDIPALGERRQVPEVTQSQVAATVAAVLGLDFHAAHPRTAAPLPDLRKP